MSRYDDDYGSRGRDRDSDLSCKVYVGDLSRDTNEKDLERAFNYYGPLRNVWVSRNPAGFAFVEFESSRDADDAVRGLDGSTLGGSRVRVEHSHGKQKPKPWERNGRGGGSRGPPPRYGERRGFDPNDKCFECGQAGHYAYDCRQRQGRGAGGRRPPSRRSRSRSRSYDRNRRSYSRSRSRSVSRNKSRSRSASPARDKRRSNDRRSNSRNAD